MVFVVALVTTVSFGNSGLLLTTDPNMLVFFPLRLRLGVESTSLSLPLSLESFSRDLPPSLLVCCIQNTKHGRLDTIEQESLRTETKNKVLGKKPTAELKWGAFHNPTPCRLITCLVAGPTERWV